MQKDLPFTGNYCPLAYQILLITNPSNKGCKELVNILKLKKCNPRHWSNLDKCFNKYNIPPDQLENQIIKLAKTSKLIEAKNLQYRVLRNTCITNNKLFQWKILESQWCSLCNHPSQNSTHRFFSCPHIEPVWNLLSDITQQTAIEHVFFETCSTINVRNIPKNHPLTSLTNLTRLQIENAHCNEKKYNPI